METEHGIQARGRFRFFSDAPGDPAMGADHARQSFAPANWQRLQLLRKKYDPEGIFFDYLEPT